MKFIKETLISLKGYSVNKKGELINSKGYIINGTVNKTGYRATNVRLSGKSYHVHFHRMQAFQKYGNKIYNENLEVRHLNGNKLDNSFDNIFLGTHSDNMKDIPKKTRIKKAIFASSFIKKHNHKAIKAFRQEGATYKKIMERFNIASKGTISYIINH